MSSLEILDIVDDLLKTGHKPMSLEQELVTSGSVGDRVFANFARKPGICGKFHFVHMTNIPDLLELRFEEVSFMPRLRSEYTWYPSHLYVKHYYAGFVLEERKFITQDDRIVNECTVTPNSERLQITVKAFSSVLQDRFGMQWDYHGTPVAIQTSSDKPEVFEAGIRRVIEREVPLNFCVAVQFRVEGEACEEKMVTLQEHREQFSQFFEHIPILSCSDPELEKVYYYRWFLLRHNLTYPRLGNLPYHVLFEGRYGIIDDRSDWSDGTNGAYTWEFSRAIGASVPLHLMDLKWGGRLDLLKEDIQTFLDQIGLEGKRDWTQAGMMPGWIRTFDMGLNHYYFHILPHVVWQIYEIYKDPEWLASVAPPLWNDLAAWETYDIHGVGLPVLFEEGSTAMELGPASHFGCGSIGYEKSIRNVRTELAAFYALNYRAFQKIYTILGDAEKAKLCKEKSAQIVDSIQSYMWHAEEGYYLENTEELTPIRGIKQAGGIFPLLVADPPDADAFLGHINDPNAFNLPYGIPSVSKNSWGYYPNNTYEEKRPHMCMWNGPTWPFSTTFALHAIGRYAQRSGDAAYAEAFTRELGKYQKQHFLYGDPRNLCLVEHYNPETGMPLSGEDHYNHSGFIHFVIEMLGGFSIGEDGRIRFAPIPSELAWLHISGIPFEGKTYTVEIDSSAELCRYFAEPIEKEETASEI
ncbi:hypothetical protein ACFSR7_02095 [Cohnella sp. GCM10020058]|uniref:MGH1-like glycoside hydrolase domain-containing protein n=1 Tax=Cohnella sp. GCM10020058 TaxID=3317330 RepID=UPI0036270DAC